MAALWKRSLQDTKIQLALRIHGFNHPRLKSMPVLDLQDKLGIDLDRWFLTQTTKQPHQMASMCHAFEKEWLECSAGIGQTRAKKECRLEMEDLTECINMHKMIKRLVTITEQRKKLIKEGKYTPPDYHSGKTETGP